MISNITCQVYTHAEFNNIVYGSQGSPIYKNLEDKIRYFQYSDLQFHWVDSVKFNRERSFFIVLYSKKTIIGVISLGYNPYLKDITNHLWISYFSITEKFQNKGLSKIMLDTLFQFAKNNNYVLEGSKYTEMGNQRLSSNINKWAELYKVNFIPSEY